MITLVLIGLALVYVIGGAAFLLHIAWWGVALLAAAIVVRHLSDIRQARVRATEQEQSLGVIPELMRRDMDRPRRPAWDEFD